MWSFQCIRSSLQGVIRVSVIGIVPYEASGAPQGFGSIGVYWSMSNSEHLGLFQSYLPRPNSELSAIYFFRIPYSLRKYLKKFENF